MLRLKFKAIALVFVTLLFVGCNEDTPDESSDGVTELVFSGAEATLTTTTGEELAENLATSQSASSLNSVDSSEGVNSALASISLLPAILNARNNIEPTSDPLNAVQTITETTVACTDGGTMTLSGTVDDVTYAIDLTTSMSSCIEGTLTTSGSMQVTGTIDNSGVGTLSTKILSNYSETDSSYGNTVIMYAGTTISFTLDGTNIVFTSSIKASVNGVIYASENSSWVSDLYATSMYQTSGREYINNMTEWVDFDTSYDMSATPLVYSAGVLVSGESQYVFSSGGTIHLTVTSDNTVQVDVDNEPDGTIDTTSTITLSTL